MKGLIRLNGSRRSQQRGFTVPLLLKIFLAITAVVASALLAAILVTRYQGERAANAQIARDLRQIAAAQTSVEDAMYRDIQVKTDFVSADPNVAQYFEAAGGGDDLGLDELGLTDSTAIAEEGAASIADLLAERAEKLEISNALVLDASGNVLARWPDAGEQIEENLSQDPFVGLAVTAEMPEAVTGYWLDKGKLHLAAVSPIALGENLVGFVVLANELNKSVADRIAKIADAQVALYVKAPNGFKLIGSSLAESNTKTLEAALSGDLSKMQDEMAGKKRVEIVLDNLPYTGELRALSGDKGKVLGEVLALTRTDISKSSFKAIQNAVNLTGLAALALSLLASWFLARAILSPVRKLASAADKAADGDYTQQVDMQGNDEIAKLGHAFNELLSSLREKGDMEGYVSNLSKFLPEPGADNLPVSRSFPHVPPSRFKLCLIGIEFRRFGQDVPLGQEAIFLTQLASLHSDAEGFARSHDGRVLEQNSSRLVLGFGGDEKELRALHALNVLLSRAASLGPGAAPAAAIHEGEVVHGSLPNYEPATAVIGLGIAQLHRLLSEAGPGQILLGPASAKAIASVIAREVNVALSASSGKKFYALTQAELSAIPALPEPARDPNATRVDNETRAATGAVNENNAHRLAPGMKLGGRYEIQSVLGAGGMGVVYKAHDVELDDLVALKMLRGAALMDPEHLDRLKSELKLARKITHPNILRTHDFGDVNGQPFISMEYVRGMTLRYLIEQSGKLPFSAGLRIAKQISGGLYAAHSVGVLHRDIKPENVILESTGNAKLMDFGIARPIRRTAPGHTQPGMFIGTPNYSPPEALAGEEVDARSDIYSMGVMFCEMFCGALPFVAGNTMEMYFAHSQQAPIKPSTLWPEIPKDLESIILRCLEKSPASRFESANALLDALSKLKA
jgi:eukaryotic-like serine/threonine-protein kinase